MERIDRASVKQVVVDEIRLITQRPDLIVEEEDSINYDTLWHGDDFGSIFVLEVEDRLKVRVSFRAWSDVRTVGDAIDLLTRMINGVVPSSPFASEDR